MNDRDKDPRPDCIHEVARGSEPRRMWFGHDKPRITELYTALFLGGKADGTQATLPGPPLDRIEVPIRCSVDLAPPSSDLGSARVVVTAYYRRTGRVSDSGRLIYRPEE